MKQWFVVAAALAIFAAQTAFAQGGSHGMPVVVTSPTGSYLGVGIKDVEASRAKELKLKEEAGVEVTRVDENSPAEKAGLRAGDVILEYNGQRVEGIEQFSRLVRETPAGREVKLGVFRNGSNQTIMAKIGTKRAPSLVPFDFGNFSVRIPDIPRTFMGWRSSLLGVEVESLDGQLADFFGVKDGVLVRSVSPGSAAEKAGIKAGDVITKVDDYKVASAQDMTTRLRASRGKSVPVGLIRDHKEVTVAVAVPGDDRSDERIYARPLGNPALL